MKKSILLILFILFISSCAFAQTNLITNGSFETSDLTGWYSFAKAGVALNTYKDGNYLFATDGNYIGTLSAYCPNTGCIDYSGLQTANKIMKAGKSYTLIMDTGHYSDNPEGAVYVSMSSGSTATYTGSFYGHPSIVSHSNQAMEEVKLKIKNPTDEDLYLYFFRYSNAYPSVQFYALDNIRLYENLQLINTITTTEQPVGILEQGYIYTEVTDNEGNTYTGNDVNVTINMNGDTNPMVWNTSLSLYEFETPPLSRGTYTYYIDANKTGAYEGVTTQGSWKVDFSTGDFIGECVQNCDISFSQQSINLFNNNNKDDVIFWTQTPAILWIDLDANYTISNDNANKSMQYYVYVSDDGENWVFSDTINYGSFGYDGLQKIWEKNKYEYKFSDTFSYPNERKYYKLVYAETPFFSEVSENLFINEFDPSNTYIGTKLYDVFQNSIYSRVKSYSEKKFSELVSSDYNAGYIVQFTAYATEDIIMQVGSYENGNFVNLQDITINGEKTTYHIRVNPTTYNSRLGIKTSDSSSQSTIYITDYTISPVKYFAEQINIIDIANALSVQVKDGVSYEVILEGLPFKATTKILNPNNEISKIRWEVILQSSTVQVYEEEINTSGVIDITQDFGGVIDRLGSYFNPSTLRSFTIKATILDNYDMNVATQYKVIKLLQYPNNPNDFSLTLTPISFSVGEYPEFNLYLKNENPSNLIGIELQIFDENKTIDANGEVINPNYKVIITADELGCNNFVCNKILKIDDWKYPYNNNYRVYALALVKTEEKYYNNPLLLYQFGVSVGYNNYETTRLMQLMERTDFIYKSTEAIPLVMQLRDVGFNNLNPITNFYITLEICENETLTTCTQQTNKFVPNRHIYDRTSGYNYYIFNTLFYQDNGQLLPDGNYIRFIGHIEDLSDSFNGDINIGLAPKCKTYPVDANLNIIGRLFNMANEFFSNSIYGCVENTDEIITIGHEQEKGILIDNDDETATNGGINIACVNPETSTYTNNLEQSVYCAVFEKIGEKPLNYFEININNNNSDFSRSDEDRQYFTFKIPADEIIFNDVVLLQEALNKEYSTDSIDTIGEFIYYGFDSILGYSPLDEVIEGVNPSGLITNIGFDINFSKSFNPNYVSNLFFVKIDGLKTINYYDYAEDYPILLEYGIEPKDLVKWGNLNGVRFPKEKASITVISRNGEETTYYDSDGVLVVNVDSGDSTIIVDGNNVNTPAKIVKFNFDFSRVENNAQDVSRVSVPLSFSYVFQTSFFDEVGNLFSNPAGFLINNWFFVFIIIVFVLVLSVIVRNFKGRGVGG